MRRRAIGKFSRRTGAGSRTSTKKISATGNGRAIESASANETSRLNGDFSRQSKNRTISGTLKQMFKSAAKALGARDDAQEAHAAQTQGRRERKRLHQSAFVRRLCSLGRIAARGRYAGMRSAHRAAVKLRRTFAAAADDAALPEISDIAEPEAGNTQEWLTLWQQSEDFGHGFDNEFSAHQDRNFPSP